MSATAVSGVVEHNGQHVPCLVEILEQFGWRVNNVRGQLSLTARKIRLAKRNQQKATALALEGDDANLAVELHSFENLLDECVDWPRLRTGLSSTELFKVGLTALEGEAEKLEVKRERYENLLDECVDWACRRTGLLTEQILRVAFKQNFDDEPLQTEYRALAVLDERGETADLWRALLSNDRDALVSVNLLRSRESMPRASETAVESPKLHQPPVELAAGDSGDVTESEFVFQPDGDGYFLRGFGEEGHVTATGATGLHDIYRLVQSPGVPVPMLELDAGRGAKHLGGDSQSKQPIANSQTRQDITDKRRDLQTEIERADSELDKSELHDELEKLNAGASKLFGLKGMPRDVNNPNDKLRPKIHGRIGDACEKLKTCKPKPFPKIAEHFKLTTGATDGACFVYKPGIPNLLWRTEPTSKPQTY